MRSARRFVLAATLCALAAGPGCAPLPQGEVGYAVPDLELYKAYVHPLFEGSCATLDCHGDPGRPLRLYSATGLRIRGDLRAAPGMTMTELTDEELADNVQSIAAIDVDEPDVDARFLLLKPLSNTGGGIHHYGGQIWSGTDDVAYRCVHGWLLGTVDVDACAAARVRDGLPPL